MPELPPAEHLPWCNVNHKDQHRWQFECNCADPRDFYKLVQQLREVNRQIERST